MDFNPLMLLAGNLTSIIQGSGEEGLRKMRKREREGGKEEGREVGKEGGGAEAQMHLWSVSHVPLPPPSVPSSPTAVCEASPPPELPPHYRFRNGVSERKSEGFSGRGWGNRPRSADSRTQVLSTTP